MSISLLIADRNPVYRARLAAALANRCSGVYTITACQTATELEQQLDRQAYDTLLLEPALYSPAVDLQNAKLVLLLTEGDAPAHPDGPLSDCVAVTKYQKATDLSELIQARLAEAAAKTSTPITMTVLTVCSPSGGAGVTTAAAAMAQTLAGSGKRTLYLNLEPFASQRLFFTGEGPGLSEMFVTLQRQEPVAPLVKSYVRQDPRTRVWYIPAFDSPGNPNDPSVPAVPGHLSAEELRTFMEALDESGLFDIVITDVGCAFGASFSTLLDISDSIMIVTGLSDAAQIKLNHFHAMPANAPYRQKMKLIYNKKPAQRKAPDSDIPLLFEIPPLMPSSFSDILENIMHMELVRCFV